MWARGKDELSSPASRNWTRDKEPSAAFLGIPRGRGRGRGRGVGRVRPAYVRPSWRAGIGTAHSWTLAVQTQTPHSSRDLTFARVPHRQRRLATMSKASQPELKKASASPFDSLAANNLPTLQFMDKKLFVHLQGGRKVSGVLRGFDIFLNLVLDDAVEETTPAQKHNLGNVVRILLTHFQSEASLTYSFRLSVETASHRWRPLNRADDASICCLSGRSVG